MLVIVIRVGGVPVAFVDEVDVVAVPDLAVSAARGVLVRVPFDDETCGGLSGSSSTISGTSIIRRRRRARAPSGQLRAKAAMASRR